MFCMDNRWCKCIYRPLPNLLGHLYIKEIGLSVSGFTARKPAVPGTAVEVIVAIDHLLTFLVHLYVKELRSKIIGVLHEKLGKLCVPIPSQLVMRTHTIARRPYHHNFSTLKRYPVVVEKCYNWNFLHVIVLLRWLENIKTWVFRFQNKYKKKVLN